MEKVFVYGTLRKGGCFHHSIENSEFLSPGWICGAMYSLGAYPAVTLSEKNGRKIYGEVYSVTGEVLRIIDRIEGHPGFYTRTKGMIETEKYGTIEAWIYVIDDVAMRGDLEVVQGGDWMEYINQ